MKNGTRHRLFFLQLIFFSCIANGQPFVHPGILHSRTDLERMKAAVAAKQEPIFAGYQLFIQNPASQYDYKLQGPLTTVGRNPTVGQSNYDNDANAAHQNAVMWAITGDKRYADKAIEIVNAWSSTLQSVTGRDAVLMAGLGPFKMVNAAEILRYTNAGWSPADIRKTEQHFQQVISPVIENFAPFANGNWEGAAMKTVMAIGVFCNDRRMFEKALRYYIGGGGDGRLTNYVIDEEGQIQESGRDQPHSQLGIGMLAECCAIAWNQGLNLYSYANNRLLKGFEYTAKYNLGNNDMPFQEWLDRTGKYHHTQISDKGRGELRAVYEQVYNHYVVLKALPAPYVEQAVKQLRPEGPGKPGADHPGYGTLYFALPQKPMPVIGLPATPAGIITHSSKTGNQLEWIAAIGATNYTIKRALKKEGPYTTIEKNVKETTWADKQVITGAVYYYTISATNAKGESSNAYPASIATGLPAPWKQQDINSNAKGNTSFDGNTFTIESTGRGWDSTLAEGHFTYLPLTGDGAITIRYVPQLTSQFSQVIVTIQEGLTSNAPNVSLLLHPRKTEQVEAPAWQIKLLSRMKTDSISKTYPSNIKLTEPAVTFGRLTGYLWLRLQRKGNTFSGAVSYDDKEWMNAGMVTAPLNKNAFIGFGVASGMANSTVVKLDKVLKK